MVSKKKTIYDSFEDGIEKSVQICTEDDLLALRAKIRPLQSLLVISLQADDPQNIFFYYTFTLMVDTYNLILSL